MQFEQQSAELRNQLGDYAEIAGPNIAGNFARLEDSMNGGRPSMLSQPLTELDAQQRDKYRGLSEEMTMAARQDLRQGRIPEQQFRSDFDQVQNSQDARTEVRADQQKEKQLFPNFSQRLSQLEQRQQQLNQAYQDQGLDRRLASEELSSVRSQMQQMDRAIAERGSSLHQRAGGLSAGSPAFTSAPLAPPPASANSIPLAIPASSMPGPRTVNTPKTLASPQVQAELDRYQDARGRGVAPGDINLSNEARNHLGLEPAQPQPNAPMNLFPGVGRSPDQPTLHGDTRGADLSAVNLQDYNTNGEVYDANTQFPPGYSPRANGMVRQNGVNEDYQTHLGSQPRGLARQYSTRTLEQNGQFPNPDYNRNDPQSQALVDSETFHSRFGERQMQQVEKAYQTEMDFVKEAGGYDKALAKVDAEARRVAPPRGGHGGRTAYNRARQRLTQERLGHYQTADRQAREEAKRRGLPASQLDDLRDHHLAENQRRELQSAMNVDRKELDGQWAKIDSHTLHQAADKAWGGMDTEQRRQVMGQVAQERIDMARFETAQLHKSGLQNRPESAERLQSLHQKSDARLDALQADLAAGKVEQVEAQLRRDVVQGSPQISGTELMDSYSAKQDRQGDRSFEAKSAALVDQRKELYQQNGWWEESPFYGNNDGAFMEDLGRRDVLAISPTDARRGIETLQRLQQSDPAAAEKLQGMQSKLTRAYDLSRVGQQTAALDRHFGQVLDDQGVVGDTANFIKNEFGRPGGWVVDSNLGSDAVNGSLGKAYEAREQIRDLADFQGSDAEFAKEYEKRVGALKDQLSGTEEHIGKFQNSQENWVEGISDVASVGAGLALTPVTGGAVWLAAPAAAAATKVGVKGLEAGTGSGRYQGNVGVDLLKGGINGLSAVGTSRAAAWAERAFTAGRAPGVGTWLGTRAITAAEGATDGYLTGTSGALLDGDSLGEAHRRGTQSALVGGVMAPVIRTGGEAISGLRPTADAPATPSSTVADGPGAGAAIDNVNSAPAAEAAQPSRLRLDADDLKAQGGAYLSDRGMDPKLLDQVDIRTADAGGNPFETPALVSRDGKLEMQLPADANGRVLAHDFGHELRHLNDARLAFDGDGNLSGALREADQAYSHLRELRQQGAPAQEIAAAEQAYRQTSAELRGEAGGHDFVANYFDRLKETSKPKTGAPQDAEALGRVQSAQEAQAGWLEQQSQSVPQADGHAPLQSDESLRLGNDKSESAGDRSGGLDAYQQARQASQQAAAELGYGRDYPGGVLELAGNPEKMQQLRDILETADPKTRAMMQQDVNFAIHHELREFSKGLAGDPEAARQAFLQQRPQLEELARTFNPKSTLPSTLDDTLKDFDSVVAGRRDTVATRQGWEPDRPQKRIDPNMTQEAYDPGQPSFFRRRLNDAPPMIGTRLSTEEAEQVALQMERSLDKWAGRSDVPRPPYANANLDNTYFSQGREPRVQFGQIKNGAPGVEGYLKNHPGGGPRVLEFPLEDGKFGYLMLDGHHRAAAQMIQGVRSFEDLQVMRLDELGGPYSYLSKDQVVNQIRNLHQHLFMTDTPVPR